jgi:glycogen operon protein
MGMMLSGDTMDVRDAHGEPLRDDTFLVLFNAFHEPITFVLAGKKDVNWELLLDTQQEQGFLEHPSVHASGDELELVGRSMSLLKLVKGSQEDARTASWKQRQKARPAAPPMPPAPSKHEKVDPTLPLKVVPTVEKGATGVPHPTNPPDRPMMP